MLKIKDNVDLKELEKYGFVKDITGTYCKGDRFADERVSIFVNDDKTFFIEWGWYVMRNEEQERFLKDLIRADLLEKVGEIE